MTSSADSLFTVQLGIGQAFGIPMKLRISLDPAGGIPDHVSSQAASSRQPVRESGRGDAKVAVSEVVHGHYR